VEHLPDKTPKIPGPQRTNWQYVIGAVIILTIEAGWNPTDVRALAATMLALIAVIHAARK
jgi:hypothetical protein